MRWLRNILALAPCGKPQAAPFAHLVELLQWLPGGSHCSHLEPYGGRSARPFPFARLAVAAGCVPKIGHGTWGTGWFWSGMARAPLGAGGHAVDVEEGGAYPC